MFCGSFLIGMIGERLRAWFRLGHIRCRDRNRNRNNGIGATRRIDYDNDNRYADNDYEG